MEFEYCFPHKNPLQFTEFPDSCDELPEEIQVAFHSHGSLHIEERSTRCKYCNSIFDYIFCCNHCSYQICYGCAVGLIKHHEGREHTTHLSHWHPLVVSKVGDTDCELCLKEIDGPSYGCAPCRFYIHKSCYELPQEIRHPFHPCHFLSIQRVEGSWCNACCSEIQGFGYRCDECDFELHRECVSLMPSIKWEGHEHLLTLVKVYDFYDVCGACGFEIEGDFVVRCVECGTNFHVKCGADSASLPPNIVYEHHPHPLTFTPANKFDENYSAKRFCDACKEEINPNHSSYSCVECEYHTHGCCVITEVQLEEREKLKHISHRHFLFFLKNEGNSDFICYVCKKDIEDGPSYGCEPCNYYLHKSCAELPEVINHCFHSHSLTLAVQGEHDCDACGCIFRGFGYRCLTCHFTLDLDCVLLQPSIKLDGHKHVLTFFESLHSYLFLNCISNCQKIPSFDEPYLRCVRCNFNIHLFCSPLPRTIKLTGHKHSLTLIDSSLENGYDGDTWERAYYCEQCHSVIDVDCVIPEIINSLEEETLSKASDEGAQGGGGGEAENEWREMDAQPSTLHKHPLILCDNNGENELRCPGCGNPFLDQSYKCEQCEFFPDGCFACETALSGSFYFCKICWPWSPLFHKSCGELPQKINSSIFLHRHGSLNFQEESDWIFLADYCDFCYRSHGNYKFSCECHFKIDFGCIKKLVQYHEGREHIKHFSHQHPLTSLKLDDVNCKVCNKITDDPTYACAPCEFLIHNSCREFPQKIKHSFHPLHCLTFEEIQGKFACSACCFNIEGFGYQCKKCHFVLHPECASLEPNINCKSHEHLLTLLDNISNKDKCEACSFDILGTFYARCVQCDINFHIQCGPDSASLPPTIVYEHHQHPLNFTDKLVRNDSTLQYCDACKGEISLELSFYCCVKCEYYTHIRCAITEIQLEDREKLSHFSHQHYLYPHENIKEDDIICCGCKMGIQDGPMYGCEPCKYYLHKSCIELPRRILHPFHRHYLWLRKTDVTVNRKCSACHNHCNGFTFRCDRCNFSLDLDCPSILPSIKFESHDHILNLFEKVHNITRCIVCNLVTSPNASYLRCVECDLNFHLLCCPLPQVIEHWSHQHSLSLKDNFVEHSCDDEYYCDACEIKRHNGECVYYCAECSFVIDFDCAISEVILALQKEPRDVQLRTVSREITDKVITRGLTYKEISESFTEEENKIMDGIRQNVQEEMRESREALSKARYEANVSEKPAYSDEDFLWLMTRFTEEDTVELIESADFQSKFIHVENCIVVEKFAPVFQNWLDKYGDISTSCNLNPKLKTIFLVKLCATMQSMSNTKVRDISDRLIFTWWYYSKLVQRAGFRIDFVFDHYKRIAKVLFVTDSLTSESGPVYQLLEEIGQLSEEIDELTQEFNKRTEKMDKLRKQKEEKCRQLSKNSRMEAEQLLEYRRKNAATGLLCMNI